MEHLTSSLDLPVPAINMKMVGHVSSNPESHNFSLLREQKGLVEPVSGNPIVMIPINRVEQNESPDGRMGSVPNTAFPVKRKAEVGPQLNNSISQQSQLPNKRPAHVGANSFGFMQPSAPQKKTAPTQSKLGSPGLQAQPSLNKKMVRNDSVSGKPGLQRGQTAKKQTVQIGSKSKAQSESSEALRSKMRESLAAALALAFKNQDNVSNTEKKQSDGTANDQMPVDTQDSKASSVVGRTNDFQVFHAELPPKESSGNGGQTFQDFQYTSILPDEEVSFGNNFFAKDDLLQGNGLSWAFDFDRNGLIEKPESVKEETPETKSEEAVILTPENLALKIEAELFKLFGGVNKKYKEKGRSILFNLKDRNNPELRERVMSGEISPERLCSMSAEELASKELSQWRMAKAEEMAKMVVLPEVDIKRFVRKTHKGEYQVEVQHDDVIAAEVSSGTSMLTQPQPKKEIENKENVAGPDSSSEDQEFSGSLVIPADGTDLMQGMMVDDLKDAEFLPPIVSLDEFMESLNSEPPFENLAEDAAEQKTPISHLESPKPVNNSPRPSNRASVSPKDASSKKADVIKKHQVDMMVKSSGSPEKEKVVPSVVPKVEYIWEGILQLTISASVTVGGLFQSGEKTSTEEWPTSLEIKGRVRLDAFEKFVSQLPMSRTRAVMVLEVVLRDKSSQNEVSDLAEAVDSYVTDERLGFAEPAPGVELYLCPPTSRMFDVLKKHMPKLCLPETNIENGLIGVVVWRRAHISNTISPNSSSSHHKSAFKKQAFAAPNPKRVQDSPSNVNVNSSPVFNKVSHFTPQPVEEDDDIPPGFGHVAAAAARVAAKDDDDLPEFNFSGQLNPSIRSSHNLGTSHGVMNMNHPPLDQVRELIQKYGQSGSSGGNNRNLGIKPWNDDDDDIPEWNPHVPPPQQHHQAYTVVAHGHRPPMNVLSPNYMAPVGTHQPPPPPGGGWVQPPPGYQHDPRWRQQ